MYMCVYIYIYKYFGTKFAPTYSIYSVYGRTSRVNFSKSRI